MYSSSTPTRRVTKKGNLWTRMLAVWTMLCESLEGLTKEPDNGDIRHHVIDCLEILARWLRMGGFPPTITGGDNGKLPGARSCTH
jgi:hypothetical protein